MDLLDASRWQFGITTVYHFIFVPLTLGLAPMLAIMQTVWVKTGRESWLRATKFFGKLFVINFTLGIVTGIVQEFQFGMNWSAYSRFVGDVFGAPLAIEGIVAFFLESTFLGIWIFGWNRIPQWMHTVAIWAVALSVNMSAYFIIVANSFMQHPVGAEYNPETNRAELNDFFALMTNNTALAAFAHTFTSGLLVASTLVAGVCGWWMVRNMRSAPKLLDGKEALNDATTVFRPVFRFALLVMIIAGVSVIGTGDVQGKLMFEQQPMKMASAESLCHTETDPKMSILTVGTHNNCDSVHHLIEVPFVLPFLAEGKFEGVRLEGVENLQKEYEEKYGSGNYTPNLFVTYWSFRAMIGLGIGSIILAICGLWVTRKNRVPNQRWFAFISIAAIPFPFLACSCGWIFTEMGRQPWVVHPNPTGVDQIRLVVGDCLSDKPVWEVLTSLIVLTLLYAVLAVIWFILMRRYVRAGLPPADAPQLDLPRHAAPIDDDPNIEDVDLEKISDDKESEVLSFAY